jgi:pimeloyl-ACP methyl ester carboxylesterase
MTPEMLDISLKNRHTVARLAWEPRLHDPFLHKWLHRIEVPVKIVWGAEDKILPSAFASEFKRLMPKAEVEIVANCGHLPQAEKPERFCEIVFACK